VSALPLGNAATPEAGRTNPTPLPILAASPPSRLAAFVKISKAVARRYLLGRQGLWPGRRWVGKDGAAAAMRQVQAIQVDPLNVVARSHDLALSSRVAGYEPAQLDTLLYQDRAFFDYGACLMIYPMEELPYWRVHMRRRASHPRQAAFVAHHAALLDEVRAALRERGPLGSRDFDGNVRVASYRARKDTGLALYHLWLTGELMTHSRRRFERVFAFHADVAPPGRDGDVSPEEADAFFARKALAAVGLHDANAWAREFAFYSGRRVPPAERRQRLAELVECGAATVVAVDGYDRPCFLPTADVPALERLADGVLPGEWRPLGPTSADEVAFLAPLDGVLERGRARWLFDFDYIWEVYKPAAQRRWGYYTLPILWGDRLVGRLDPKLDRATATLAINGFWLEDSVLAADDAFAAALAHGLGQFARFHEARRIDFAGVDCAPLKERLPVLVGEAGIIVA